MGDNTPMPSEDRNKALLQIHFCVLLWGFTAIFGKLISLSALPLVWWRMLLVVAALMLVPMVWRGVRRLSGRHLLGYAGIGALVALHWLTFYGSVKLANASVAATCIALALPLTSLIEPWVARTPFRWNELGFGVVMLPGVALVVGGVSADMRLGIVVGVVSAVLVALFGSLNKRMVDHADPLTVTAVELGAGVLLLTLMAPLMPWIFPALGGDLWVLPEMRDAIYLVVLAGLCTLLPYALSLVTLRHLSAYTVQLVTNLEPVYAIIIAIIVLGEQHELTPMFYLGVVIILAAVFLQPLLHKRLTRTPPRN